MFKLGSTVRGAPTTTSAVVDSRAYGYRACRGRIAPSRLVSINAKSKTATDCATVGPQLTNTKAHNVTRYDGMIMVGPLWPSARARVPWSFVVPRACAVAAFVRPRFGTALAQWHLAIVDPLLVTRLDAESLLGSAARLVVAPYAVGKRCHIGRGQPHQ